MDKKNITPNPAQPIDRIPTGQLPNELAELSEETLSSGSLLPSSGCLLCFSIGIGLGGIATGGGNVSGGSCFCSYDDDAG